MTGSDFNASVIHDSYCYRKGQNISPGNEPQWSQIHRMFYEGMRCSGTGEFEAKTKYWAVRKWGPPADRSIFQRFFGSPDGRTVKTPDRGPAGEQASKLAVLLSDADIASFFASMTQTSNVKEPTVTEFQVSPSAQTLAATKVASELNRLHAIYGADYSRGSSSRFGVSASPHPWVSTDDSETWREMGFTGLNPKDLVVAPTYVVTRSPEEKEAVEVAIYIAQHADRLSEDDLDQLAEKGIPKNDTR